MLAAGVIAAAWPAGNASKAYAQSTTRLVLSSGTGIPAHAGFVFGPFSNLAMNEADDVAFLTSLRSARIDLRAIVRSTGVTFSVVAFQGLRSPVPRTTYDSFSSPSINGGGVIAFSAQLKDDVPLSAVIRVEGGTAKPIATTADPVPGLPETTFQEFSAPLVSSAGNVLFGARAGGKTPTTGLYQWTPAGIQPLALPAEIKLTPNDLLEPVYFGHDEAVFVPRGTAPAVAVEQFFRAVAVRSFQELNPPPQVSETVEFLPPRVVQPRVRMVLVSLEGNNFQTVLLVGDPTQPVMAKQQPGAPLRPLAEVLGQTGGERGNIIIAGTTVGQEGDLALYCLCDGLLTRLTSPEEFLALVVGARGRGILSLAGDSQHTVAFVAPTGAPGTDSTAIYVTPLP